MRGRRALAAVGTLALVTSLGGLGVLTPSPAGASTANDPFASVAYQENAAHDGHYADPMFGDKLERTWSVDLGGQIGYPVIAHGIVYTSVAETGEVDVEARSLRTGAVIWGPKALPSGNYGEAGLAYDRGQLFALDYNGLLYAYDAASGARNWVVQVPGQYEFTSPPTASEGTVFVGGSGAGGTLYAIAESTGHVNWTADTENGDNSAPVVGDGAVFVSYACNYDYRFGLDGTPAWHYSGSCMGGGGSTAVLHDGDLYTRDDDGNLVLDADTGDLDGTFVSTAAPAFDGSYMATQSRGVLAVWNTKTDTRLWQSAATDNVTAPLFANGYVVEGRSDGTVELRNEQDGTIAWSGSAGTEIDGVDERNVRSLVGLALGDHALVVPAGTKLTTFAPTAPAESLSVTRGPQHQAVVGPQVGYTFHSNVPKAKYECTLDGRGRRCTSPVDYRHLAEGPHTFSVSVAGTTLRTPVRSFRVDAHPPVVSVSGFHPLVTHRPNAHAHWSATDPSGTAKYQLRVRQAHRGDRPGAWHPRPATRETSATLHVAPNSRMCVSVRAEDGVGNWSSWSSGQCLVRLGHRH